MQLAKQVPFDNPMVLMGVRGLYLTSNILILLVCLFLQSKINAKNDRTTFKYAEPSALGSAEQPKLVTTTVKAYDTQQLRSMYKSQLIGIGMMGVMHVYFKYTNPLLIQSIIPLKGALESNLAKVHLWGQPAVGDLARPWKASGFAGLGGGSEPKTDRKSVETAEKTSRGGSKEE
ncbi:MAG: hypothetical protein M1829_006220 [Trizodia sp. TS-e1964]|nr:MAG: hypothetical protein M1829_006220 [Trizodia sp. TS-e1964]